MQILLVDDEELACEALKEFLEDDHEIYIEHDGESALNFLKKQKVDVVITDHNMPKMTGIELIQKGKSLFPDCYFLMLTAHSSLEHAISALRAGADDYLMKPVNFEELEMRVARVRQLISWKNKSIALEQKNESINSMIGNSEHMQLIKGFVNKVANVQTPILINGESGTGKEVLAKSIHNCGNRKTEAFIAINCATLSEQLLESELFGHEKGAFTGAESTKIGKFELAGEGTLFLDEIGELAPQLQARLLRVIQEKEYYRLGGNRLLKTNARIVAATHKNLPEMVKEGKFREDLYFRLNVLNITLPSLRQRKDDIPVLVDYFLTHLKKELGSNSELAPEVNDYLNNKNYVGNIRELKNEIERLLVLNLDKTIIHIQDINSLDFSQKQLLDETTPLQTNELAPTNSVDLEKGLTLLTEEFERKIIESAYMQNDCNQSKTAKELKITRGALQYKLAKYHIENKKAS